MTDKTNRDVKALRSVSIEDCAKFPGIVHAMLEQAAVELESLAAELEQVEQERDGLSIMLTSAESAAETYKHERDTAIEDLRGRCFACVHAKPYDKHPHFNKCQFVSFAVGGQGKRECEHWKWRGAQE